MRKRFQMFMLLMCITGSLFASGVDEQTLALWLFDEAPYANSTLTDATPYQIDMRLYTGRGKAVPEKLFNGTHGLVPGKYGNALRLPVNDSVYVGSAEPAWLLSGTAPMRAKRNDVPEIMNLGYLDYTFEFWFKADGPQTGPAVIWEIINESNEIYEKRAVRSGFNALVLDKARLHFLLKGEANKIVGKGFNWQMQLEIPTDSEKLNDGHWHHIAFTYECVKHQMRHYVDGKLQPLPQMGGFLPMMGKLMSMRIGSDHKGGQQLVGWLDEMRISGSIRYRDAFEPPTTFSANYGPNALPVAKPNGPPLLFPDGKVSAPVNLANRKHVFIDDVLVDRMNNVRFTANPPQAIAQTDFRNTKPWETTPRMGAAIPDVCSVWDDGDDIKLMYGNNGLWGGKPTVICLANSKDGLSWEKPNLGIVPWLGSTDNNIILPNALQGSAIKDPNPQTRPEEKYKLFAWCMQRGFYVFTSPDGIHWKRNETLSLPFDPDGSVAFSWDDQTGVYRGYLRASRHMETPTMIRRIVRAKTDELLKPWPFEPVKEPLWHIGNTFAIFPLPKPCSNELPLLDTGGQVYRFKGLKYPWAPDVYLAFPWRYLSETNIRPGSFLMVSRDGETWKRYEPPYYFSSDGMYDGRKIMEALIEQGMIRRDDKLWQYGTYRFTEHGGALYGGVEHDGTGFDKLMRLEQRLDGFVSIDADNNGGYVITKPLVFDGKRLELNVNAKGSVRVAILNKNGDAFPGFGLNDCKKIKEDNVRKIVAWKKGSDVSGLAGKTVQLRFKLKNAKLYAFEFKK